MSTDWFLLMEGKQVADNRTNNSRKYAPGQLCKFDGCDRAVVSKELCSTHYTQQRLGKRLRPIGPKGKKKKTMTYSETKTCDTCEETKHWTKFVLGTDRANEECRDCYRARILPVCVEPDVNSLNELLDFIDMYFPVE